ncbi:pyridoxal-dependent decarboxylase [Coleofasciculus sp. G2-EDA-02]|uniref:pyridoxal-dependent decarboxylase n=1 Tax=Coleofasciculus sp. G2-EDA-02 TaxID=3069529 RepID=UPI003303FA23
MAQHKKLKNLFDFDDSADFGQSSRAVEAWFLGSRSENLDELENLIVEALRDHGFWRRNFHPSDPSYITESVKRNPNYLQALDQTKDSFRQLLAWLKKSVPFFSLRYQGHMTWETTMPSILGYFATMLYNPNNVAFEASTVTTLLEIEVGKDLCQMLGYYVPTEDEINDGVMAPWGHITCGGTVANIEGLWVARNLKFYPFTLKKVIAETPGFEAAKEINMTLPNGTQKPLLSLDTWTMLNLKADDILNIPARLTSECGIDDELVKNTIEDTPYTLQKMGMRAFAQEFLSEVPEQPVYFVPGTKHYSWPKAGALLGIGSNQMIDISIDKDARMNINELRDQLQQCLDARRPVLATIAVMGSTEESAVDPLADIVALRDEFRQKGLEFNIHADAAWGGYYACLLERKSRRMAALSEEDVPSPPLKLSCYTEKHMRALTEADSITVDPHKSGYIPYPAGAICYRNAALRDLLTFIAPYVNHGEEEPNVGSFGVEGSKPGAAAAAVYLSHKVIPPDTTGYGEILGRAMFSCKKLYARLLCMARPEDRFIVVPVPHLSEAVPGSTEAEKIQFIRERIDQKTNAEIREDAEVMEILREIGPDQSILTYAFNFKNPDGTINNDLAKANRLNQALYKLLSIKPGSDIYGYNLIVSTTNFETAHYGEDFMKDYKQRLQVTGVAEEPITILRSTVMDPWITEAKGKPFIDIIEEEFRKAISQALLQDAMLQVFEGIDVNRDGIVQKSEVTAKLQDLGYTPAEIDNIWKISDTNQDEKLSHDEFLANFAQFLILK